MCDADSSRPPALIHVDCDGLDIVQSCYGPTPAPHPHGDPFWMHGVPAALEIFSERGIAATFYVIAKDLHHPAQLRLAEEIRDAGHEIASHSVTHQMTRRLSPKVMRDELTQSRDKIGEALGIVPDGFRAPGFAMDPARLALVAEVGYRHDSSLFPSPWGAPLRWARHWMGRRGSAVQEPYGSLRDGLGDRWPRSVDAGGRTVFEIPVSLTPRLRLPAHASYALLRSDRSFGRTLAWHARQRRPFVWLIHLIDFVDTTGLSLPRAIRATAAEKRSRLRAMLEEIARQFEICRTDQFARSALEGHTQAQDAEGAP